MSIRSVKDVLTTAGLAAGPQFESQCRNWRTSRDNGNPETLLAFLGREAGISEDTALQSSPR